MDTGARMFGLEFMKHTQVFKPFSLLILLLALACPVSAQEEPAAGGEAMGGEATEKKEAAAKEESTDVIRTGTIASSGEYASGNAVDVDTQGSAPGDEPSTIQGSVSQIGRGKCRASITNSSEENTYSVRFRVIGTNERGAVAIKKTFSATLKPSQTQNRKLACKDNLRMQVVLLSANKR